MNRFNFPQTDALLVQAEGLLRCRSISSALVVAVENKPGGWTAIQTFHLLQMYLGLFGNACLFSYIQVRVIFCLRIAATFHTLPA
jgi:hypothetical protein